MANLRRAVLVFLFVLPVFAFAQSADQEVVSVVDAPDPVTPGSTLTYTITLTNHGPDSATNGGINVNLPGEVTYQNTVVPAGFSCATFGASVSCTTPSFAPGTVVFVMSVTVAAHLVNFPDGQFTANFFPSGTTPDPNNANNLKTATTSYDTPQIDLSLAVTDSPDPVTPDNNITYTIDVTNAGPDTATSVNFNVFHNSGLLFQSATEPAGWNCTLPAVNGAPIFTCTTAAFIPSTVQFTVVVRADDAQLGILDGSVQTNFSVNGTGNDTNQLNNSETETTGYVTPDADLTIAVTDSPDPVFPDGDITYTVTVSNTGPDTATNVNFNVFNNNTLRYQSIVIPAGWSCPSQPAVDGAPVFTCTNPSFANGASSIFTVVVRAYDEVLGINDGTVQTAFSVNSGNVADPDNSDNSETETTAYVTPDANLSITATDSPDPVANGALLTYTINAASAGPDAAPNAQIAMSPHPSLTFQSLSAAAGWSCTTPAVDAVGIVTCTRTSMAGGEAPSFTLVTRLVTSGSGGTVNSVFTIVSNAQDPVPANNSVEVFTNWIGQTSDLGISKHTFSTAAAQGGTITYTISTTNHGPDAASNVTITDVLHPALRFQSITSPAGWSCTTPAAGANGTITCSIASFPNGAGAQFTLVVTVDPNSTGSITNSASIASSTATDPSSGNSSGSSTAVPIAGNADLAVTKTTPATSAARGGTVTYTITVSNSGPDPAASATLTDELPASLLFQSISAPAGWTCITPAVGATGTISCSTASLTTGAPAVFTLTTTVAPSATGTFSNTASASHTGTDANPSNHIATAGPTAVDPGTADLAATKTTATTTVAPGGTFSYTIGITNNGPDAAANVVMTDTLPASLLFQSLTAPAGWTCTTPAAGASGTITCNAATLANGATANFTLTVQVAQNATGTLVNNVSASSEATDPNPTNSATASAPLPVGPPSADVSVTKTTTATNVPFGTTFTYTITVNNLGPSDATSVVVNDTLPPNVEFVSATPSQGTCNAASPLVCTLGTIPAGGGSATIALQVRAVAAGTASNTATVVSATDGTPGNNSDAAPNVIVVGGPAAEAEIPTLSEWALIALMMMVAMVAAMRMRT